MTTPDVTVDRRDPQVQFLRQQAIEIGATVMVYWNGTKAANGDGLPGGDAAISYATALAGPLPIWRRGQRSIYGGGFMAGGFMEAHAQVDPSFGWLAGGFMAGGFLDRAVMWRWRFPFLLRDGIYRIALRMRDAAGNEQATDAATLVMEVAALPRAARNLVVTLDGEAGTLTATWEASPDLQAA